MSEIINNVAGTLHWDIFLMGFFTLLFLITAVLWVSNSRIDFLDKIEDLKNSANSLKLKRAGVGLVITLVVTYYVGIMVNTCSDIWIDKKDGYHLFLKWTWLEEEYRNMYKSDDAVKSDDAIKIRIFEDIYNYKSVQQDYGNITRFYYIAKNKLWEKEVWRKYILYSQTMINISRVWCFTFFLSFLVALLRFFLYLFLFLQVCVFRKLIKQLYSKAEKTGLVKKLRFDAWLSLLVAGIMLLGYYIGGIVWQSNEEEIDSKIFGVYRSEFGLPPESLFLNYKVTELVTKEKLEASGIAGFDDHLFIVNDKNSTLYVVNPKYPVCPLTVIEDPGFPQKAKFEDITYHPESGIFYVIGAHYSTKRAYQKTFQFKLQPEADSWRPFDIKPISISKYILQYLKGKERVEGLAVAGTSETPKLFIGIRSDKSGQFKIMEFSSGQSGFVLKTSYELPFAPKCASGNVPYHLSGLTAISDTELLVLATSEDADNGFHGNRVYTFDLSSRIQKSVTPEFALAQKAEGITFLATTDEHKTKQRIAIVFDNDLKDTGQPSRLLIADSLQALHSGK